MTIEQIDSSKLLITLCSCDMEDYRLEFGTMGFENPHSRKILNRLINIVCTKTGLSSKNKKLLLEALPYDNGCIILVTFMEKQTANKKYKIKKHGENACYIFLKIEDMIKAVTMIYSQKLYVPSAAVYSYKEKYYLIFHSSPLSRMAKRILSEYGKRRRCERIFLSSLDEAGQKICGKNAISTLGKAFSK